MQHIDCIIIYATDGKWIWHFCTTRFEKQLVKNIILLLIYSHDYATSHDRNRISTIFWISKWKKKKNVLPKRTCSTEEENDIWFPHIMNVNHFIIFSKNIFRSIEIFSLSTEILCPCGYEKFSSEFAIWKAEKI